MANLSLTNANEEIRETSKSSIMNLGTTVLFILLILILAAYGGMVLWKINIDKNTEEVKNFYQAELDKFSGNQAKTVADISHRADVAKEVLGTEFNTPDYLSKIEKLIIPGVFLKSYEYSDETKSIILLGLSDNYNNIAKQILAFKSAEDFSSVTGGKTQFDSENKKIEFTIELKNK